MCGDVFNTGVGARPWYSNPISQIVTDILYTPTQIIKTGQSLVTDVVRWSRGEINMGKESQMKPASTTTQKETTEDTTVGGGGGNGGGGNGGGDQGTITAPPGGGTVRTGPVTAPSTNPNDPNYIGDPNATYTQSQKKKRQAALRRGLAATIKTSPIGVTSAANISMPEVVATGLKMKLGA